ncbi:MAG: hypothetical protein OXT49_02170 [Gammaproteobacteria bacterium]|nr:hypothetical protein [Gammaproteobacteria bacterium]
MKLRNSLSTNLVLAAGLTACGHSHTPLEQCQQVVKTYIQWSSFEPPQQQREGDSWVVHLAFEVKSALGVQAGSASCEYAMGADGEVAERPYAISLGNTRHTGEQNITDLLNGRYADGEGLPDHAH